MIKLVGAAQDSINCREDRTLFSRCRKLYRLANRVVAAIRCLIRITMSRMCDMRYCASSSNNFGRQRRPAQHETDCWSHATELVVNPSSCRTCNLGFRFVCTVRTIVERNLNRHCGAACTFAYELSNVDLRFCLFCSLPSFPTSLFPKQIHYRVQFGRAW